jgi:hypothetical protein
MRRLAKNKYQFTRRKVRVDPLGSSRALQVIRALFSQRPHRRPPPLNHVSCSRLDPACIQLIHEKELGFRTRSAFGHEHVRMAVEQFIEPRRS